MVFSLLDDEIKMLAEDTDDLDEFYASMFKDDDEKDDVQEKRGMKKIVFSVNLPHPTQQLMRELSGGIAPVKYHAK